MISFSKVSANNDEVYGRIVSEAMVKVYVIVEVCFRIRIEQVWSQPVELMVKVYVNL